MSNVRNSKTRVVQATNSKAAARAASADGEKVFLNVSVPSKTRRGLSVLKEVLALENQGQVLERLVTDELKRHGRRVR